MTTFYHIRLSPLSLPEGIKQRSSIPARVPITGHFCQTRTLVEGFLAFICVQCTNKSSLLQWEVVNPFRGPPAGLKRPGTVDRPSPLPGVDDSNSIFMLKFLYDIALKLYLFTSSSEELATWWACDVVTEGLNCGQSCTYMS